MLVCVHFVHKTIGKLELWTKAQPFVHRESQCVLAVGRADLLRQHTPHSRVLEKSTSFCGEVLSGGASGRKGEGY